MMAETTIRARNRGKESPGLNREAGSAVVPLGGAAAMVLWTTLLSSGKYSRLSSLYNTEEMIILPGALSRR